MRACAAFGLTAGLVLLCAVFPRPLEAGVLDELIQRQQGTRTVKARFQQEKHTELLQRPIKSSGAFHFMYPSKVRWVYEGQDKKPTLEVIYDGETLVIYYPKENEAERVGGVSRFSLPVSFDIKTLQGKFKLSAKKTIDEILVKIEPRGGGAPFEHMEMKFRGQESFPSEVKIMEKTRDTAIIKFYDVLINADIPEGLFRFIPPPGVKIRERGGKQ